MPAGRRTTTRARPRGPLPALVATIAAMAVVAMLVAGRGSGVDAAANLAPNAAALDTVNYYRASTGLGPVTVNANWVGGAVAHARYTVKTGSIGHTEDPSSPYASAEGAAAAANGNVAMGGPATSDRQFAEQWLQGPFHAVSMLSPRLRQTAYGSYREDHRAAATLDVLRGFDATMASPTQPVTFPVNGAALPSTMARVAVVEQPDPYASCSGGRPANPGQPLYVFLPSTPTLLSASLTVDGAAVAVCSYTEATVTDPVPADQQLKRSILAKDHAVVVLPLVPLVDGRSYQATVRTADRTVAWSFTVGEQASPEPTIVNDTTTTVTSNPRPPATTTTKATSTVTSSSSRANSTTSTTPGSGSSGSTLQPGQPPPPLPAQQPATAAGAFYQPSTPSRVLDTHGGPGPVGIRPAGAELALDLSSWLPSGTTAVALNVTVTAPEAGGYLTVWPTGAAAPLASNLNYVAGETVPNAVVVPVGNDRHVSLLTAAPAHLVVDLFGWFTPVSTPVAAGRFVAAAPTRAFDSRAVGDGRGLSAGETRPVSLAAAGVPADASAVAVNLTVTGATGGGYLTAWGGGAMPGSSNANFGPGDTTAGFALVPVAHDATNVPYLNVYVAAGTQVVVDVNGWFTGAGAAPSTSGLFVPAEPRRALDSRVGPGPIGLLPAGGTVDVADARAGTDPAALVANVTVTEPAAPGFVTAYPAGPAAPWASNLNTQRPGQTRANLAVTATGSGDAVRLLTTASAHLVVDVAGWFRR